MSASSGLPAFDNSVRMREAVRSAARRLIIEKGYSPNKQASLINGYLAENRKGSIPIQSISASTWIDFVRPGSKRVPLDNRIIHAAWLWMTTDCKNILKDELTAKSSAGQHAFRGLIDQLLSSQKVKFSAKEYTILTHKRLRIGYKFGKGDLVAVGVININPGANEGNLDFYMILPRYDHRGNLVGDRFSGNVVPFYDGILFLGKGNKRRPLLMFFGNEYMNAVGQMNQNKGTLVYIDGEGYRETKEFVLYEESKVHSSYDVFYPDQADEYASKWGEEYSGIGQIVRNL